MSKHSSETRKVALICGSESDLPLVKEILNKLNISPKDAQLTLHIMSCHRNPLELAAFAASSEVDGLHAIIGVGSKALALPGMLDAFLHANGKEVPVVGVAIGEGKSLETATLSIEELPGQPVVMDEINGIVYSGQDGLKRAVERVVYGELPPRPPRVEKTVKMDVWKNF